MIIKNNITIFNIKSYKQNYIEKISHKYLEKFNNSFYEYKSY